ncbi:MAG: hypothetical protein LBR30_05755 [Clostridioides sp.]|jgi:serine/threonine protein phosphatase PrpC|nr:hypothetical protein [Clostridioides sp.]
MSLIIEDYCLLCNQGASKYNEDIAGITPFGAWVLDGATGLNDKNLVSNTSDARWYVHWWNDFLYQNISSDKSLKEIISLGIFKIKKDYLNRLNGKIVEKIDFPSSSIAILKFHKEKIEYFSLGDCSIFVDNGSKKIIKDDSVCKLDNLVYEKMKQISEKEKLNFEEIRASVQNLVISNRLKKNTPHGYWILDFDENSVEKAIHGYLDIDGKTSFLLASDGFTCSCDRYDLFSEEDMIDIARTKGIEYIFNMIRKFENEDKNALKTPRFKIHDDASAILLNVNAYNYLKL